MRASGGIPIVAMLLVAIATVLIIPGSARGEDECLVAPSAPPPPGSQWHYRTDRIRQRKCWHLVPQGNVEQTDTVATQKPAVVSPLNADPASKPQPEPPATSPPPPALPENSINTEERKAENQAPVSIPPWPDPPVRAAANNFGWPDPPPPQVGITAPAEPPTPNLVDRPENSDASHPRQKIEADVAPDRRPITTIATARGQMSYGIIFAFGIGLVIAGILTLRLAKILFGRRDRIYIDRRAPRQRDPVSEQVLSNSWDDERQTLRKLLEALEQQRAYS